MEEGCASDLPHSSRPAECAEKLPQKLQLPAFSFVREREQRVGHVRQSCSWDCGLACVEMCLEAFGMGKLVRAGELRQLCRTESTWTIDIVDLLRRFGVPLAYYTVLRGVRPEYGSQEFYQKEWDADKNRVEEMFRKAERENWAVECRSFEGKEIGRLVEEEGLVAVVLLDKRYLACSLCDPVGVKLSLQGRQRPRNGRSKGFLGHYVVVYGYCESTNCFLLRDPASSGTSCIIMMHVFENARKCFGTDEDIVFVGPRDNIERLREQLWRKTGGVFDRGKATLA